MTVAKYLWKPLIISIAIYLLAGSLWIYWLRPPHERLIRTLSTQSAIQSLALSPDDQLIATTNRKSNIVTIWRVTDGAIVNTIPISQSIASYRLDLAFSADSSQLLVLHPQGSIQFWRIADGQLLQTFQLTELQDSIKSNSHFQLSNRIIEQVTALSFSQDPSLIAVSTTHGDVWVWDLHQQILLQRFHTQGRLGCPPVSLAFSSDGRLLAAGCDVIFAMLWDVTSGRTLHLLEDRDSGMDLGVAIHPEHSMMSTGYNSGEITLWSTVTGEHINILDDSAGASQIAFNHQGNLLASADANNTAKHGGGYWPSFDYDIRLWNMTNQKLYLKLNGHRNLISGLEFSHNDQLLVSAGQDGLIHIWDMR